MNMSSLSERLALAMRDASPPVSAAELSRRCRVSKAAVSDWLSGKTRDISGSALVRAAAELGVTSEWLGAGIGPMRRRPARAEVSTPEEPIDIARMERATAFVLAHVEYETMQANGPVWTAGAIITLYNLYKDPASAALTEETLLKLIS